MSDQLSYDLAALTPHDRYKILISLVIPRPIALVTTIGPTGIVNAAPFSFFNIFSEDPALCVLGLQAKPGGGLKDTSAHIRDRGAFVVNLVDEEIGEQMNQCAVDFPTDISEIDVAKFSLLPSEKIKIPRIAEAPASLECRHYTTLEVSPTRRLAIGVRQNPFGLAVGLGADGICTLGTLCPAGDWYQLAPRSGPCSSPLQP